MQVSEVLALIGPRPLMTIGPDDHVKQALRAVIYNSHSRQAYVVDEDGRLIGCLSLERLLRHLFPHHFEERIHSPDLLKSLTSDTARELMDDKPIHAAMAEGAAEVLKRMAHSGVKEMAVLDEGGRIIGDLTALDLLRHYHPEEEAKGDEG